jgi:predicted amidohydrolase
VIKVGVLQLTSKLDYRHNLSVIESQLLEAKQQNISYCFLPECFYTLSNGVESSPYIVEETGEHIENIAALAKKHKLYLLGGSVAYREQGRIVNRCLNFGPAGELLGHYDKVHLFACDIEKDGKRKQIDEADLYNPGTDSKLLNVNELKIGLGICFDVRFSSMAHDYRMNGANILTFSSAFTVPTGKAHWHTLCRARAIENQCFVIAPAQWGQNNERISTYGHSLVIDPWGNILADAGEGEKLISAELNLSQIDEVRNSVMMRLS